MPLPTLDDIARAYAETGAIPVREGWAGYCVDDHDKKCACPMGVMVAQQKGFDAAVEIEREQYDTEVASHFWPFVQVAAVLGLTIDDVRDFVAGFDGGDCPVHSEAYGLGCVARERFQPKSWDEVVLDAGD